MLQLVLYQCESISRIKLHALRFRALFCHRVRPAMVELLFFVGRAPVALNDCFIWAKIQLCQTIEWQFETEKGWEIHLPVNAEETAAAAIRYALDCICVQAPNKRSRRHLGYVRPHLRSVHVTATLQCCWFYRTTAEQTINNIKSFLFLFVCSSAIFRATRNYFSTFWRRSTRTDNDLWPFTPLNWTDLKQCM